MTGRATIGGRTRIQVIWAYLKRRPASCATVWRFLETLDPCTQTAVDKTLRVMIMRRYLTRHLERSPTGQRQYVYAATDREPPPDGRPANARNASALGIAARKARDYGQAEDIDPTAEEADDWPGERCARKGTQTELPPIPTLAQLLAR